MKRNSLEQLNRWISKSKRKPLILRGARQVGKSTLVRLFAKNTAYELVEINLEQHKDLDPIFEKLDIEEIILNLQAVSGKAININTILFLDEIQATPNALAALRYFYELKPDIPVLAAGSLLEFTLKDHSFSMPVGRVNYLHIVPMTFMEYLQEIDPFLYDLLSNWELLSPIPEQAHKNFLKRQREYMLVGGMPEAVQVFKDTNSFEEVKDVQDSICNTYFDDFSKYALNRELVDLQTIYKTIPRIIGKKVKYVHLLQNAKSAYTAALLELLVKAKITTKIFSSDLSGVPLSAGIRPKIFKLLFLDIGLLSRMLRIDIIELQNINERLLINEGTLAEQFIGQLLNIDHSQSTIPEIYYWTRESHKSNAEVDFAVAKGSLIIPIEVKSGMSGTLKSLHQLMYEKKLPIAFRFDLQPSSIQKISTNISTKTGLVLSRYKLISLPLYAVELLPKFIDQIRMGKL